MGGREVKLKIQSLDQRRQAELRFVLSAQGDVFPAGDVAAVLGKFFTPGLSYADIDGAKRDYLEDQYNAFVEAESAAADMSAAAVNDAVVRANPAGRALGQDVHNLQAKVQEQAAAIAALEKEKAAINARLTALQQEKQILDSAGRDYQERNRQLQTAETDLRKQLQRKTQDLDGVVRAIRAAGTELGLNAPPATPPEEVLQRLSRSYLQMSAGNNAYQARVKQLEGSLAKSQEELAALNAELNKNRQDQQDLAKQLDIVTTKDKALAQQMLQLQREKSVVQSKLLSQSLLRIQVDRRRSEKTLAYTATLRLKSLDLGNIVVTAPLAVNPAEPTRFTLENRLKSPAELARLSDPDLAMLLKHLKDFPRLSRGRGAAERPLRPPADPVAGARQHLPLGLGGHPERQTGRGPGAPLLLQHRGGAAADLRPAAVDPLPHDGKDPGSVLPARTPWARRGHRPAGGPAVLPDPATAALPRARRPRRPQAPAPGRQRILTPPLAPPERVGTSAEARHYPCPDSDLGCSACRRRGPASAVPRCSRQCGGL